MANEFMFKHVDELANEVNKLYTEWQLKLIKIAGMSRDEWLDYVGEQCFPNAARPAPKREYGVYRDKPHKVTPLRTQPFEYKNLQAGQPGYEREQAELDRRWRAERRRKGYPD